MAALLAAGVGFRFVPSTARSEPPALSAILEQDRARARLDMLGWESSTDDFLVALATGHRPLIDLYLDAGLPVDLTDAQGRTPLLQALLRKDWTLARRLLGDGADVARADESGTTPAMAAALGGQAELLSMIVQRGARLDAADAHGHLALHYAIVGRQRDTFEQLLRAGPVPSASCSDGCGLLGHALQVADWMMIDQLIARIDGQIEQWNEWSLAALLDAVSGADRTRARRLIEKHSTAPPGSVGGQPLLAYAIARDDPTQLRTLLDCGLDPNAPLGNDPDPVLGEIVKSSFIRHYIGKEPGLTPLMVAAALKRQACLDLLLEKGANKRAHTRGKAKLIALYFAAWADSPEGVQTLLGEVPHRDELRIEISLNEQKAELLRSGVPVFTAPISSGRKGFATPVGEFVVTDKHRDHRSSIYQDAKMPFFMRLSCRDFGLHEGILPGRPASHGCIRLPGAAARKFFREIPIGTWVTIRR
jgi:ankyrin repeat protein